MKTFVLNKCERSKNRMQSQRVHRSTDRSPMKHCLIEVSITVRLFVNASRQKNDRTRKTGRMPRIWHVSTTQMKSLYIQRPGFEKQEIKERKIFTTEIKFNAKEIFFMKHVGSICFIQKSLNICTSNFAAYGVCRGSTSS